LPGARAINRYREAREVHTEAMPSTCLPCVDAVPTQDHSRTRRSSGADAPTQVKHGEDTGLWHWRETQYGHAIRADSQAEGSEGGGHSGERARATKANERCSWVARTIAALGTSTGVPWLSG
jgi:hypothetical protein